MIVAACSTTRLVASSGLGRRVPALAVAFWMTVALSASLLLSGCGTGTGPASSTTSAGPETGTSSAPAPVPPASSSTTGGSATTGGPAGPTSAPSSGSTSPSAPSGSVDGQTDWLTYHHDAARSGVSSDQGALGSVKQVWASSDLDQAIYAQPLVVGDRVLVATEGNTVYALDAATGAVVWQTNLGEAVPGNELPCGNIDPSGITGTPVVDLGSATLYVVANLRSGPHHELFALGLADGAVRWHRAVDPPGLQPAVEQQRGALALTGGRVYVPFGGLYGDCGPYKGAVVSVAADGSGEPASYVVPTSRMAGIWNPEGPAVDANGDLWVTTGNSAGRSTFDYGNAVIKLSTSLQVQDYFAPADWPRLNAGDVDLGSLGAALLANARVLAVGKDGVAYLLDAAHLGQVGNPLGSLDTGSSAFGASANTGSLAVVPGTRALVAVSIAADKLSVAWSVKGGSCTPIIAAGAVWALGYDGTLRALDPASGKVMFSAALGSPVSRFISPAAAGGRLFIADGNRLIAFALR
jgi:outer membrane protein assembly factor BamB